METFKNFTIKSFCDELSSKSAVPGGGAVSSLSSSISCSLVSMISNLTIGKKFYLTYDEEIQHKIIEIKESSNKLKDEFLELVDKDVAAFNIVMKAFKLPKETAAEKTIRSKEIQRGYVESMKVPLEVAQKTTKLFETFEFIISYGNPNCISDAGVAILQADAAIKGAIMNVEINLGGIKNEEIVKYANTEIANITNFSNKKVSELMSLIKDKI